MKTYTLVTWDADAVRRLEIAAEHMPDRDIASAFGVSIGTIRRKRYELGIKSLIIRGRPKRAINKHGAEDIVALSERLAYLYKQARANG